MEEISLDQVGAPLEQSNERLNLSEQQSGSEQAAVDQEDDSELPRSIG